MIEFCGLSENHVLVISRVSCAADFTSQRTALAKIDDQNHLGPLSPESLIVRCISHGQRLLIGSQFGSEQAQYAPEQIECPYYNRLVRHNGFVVDPSRTFPLVLVFSAH